MRNRNEIGAFLNSRDLTGHGAEIGVHTGIYSQIILDTWQGEKLWLIDPWRHQAAGYDDIINYPDQKFDELLIETVRRLAPYRGRWNLLREFSQDATTYFPDAFFDFVYVDGNHSNEACLLDCELWWPKIRQGGLLAGHDYISGIRKGASFGVKDAVDQFALRIGKPVRLTEEKELQSWWFIKD